MRTNILIHDVLLAEAQQLSSLKTKKDIVEQSIRTYIAHLKRQNMLELLGKVEWIGDLDKMRTS